jgi:hypothetical protein
VGALEELRWHLHGPLQYFAVVVAAVAAEGRSAMVHSESLMSSKGREPIVGVEAFGTHEGKKVG